MFCKLFVITDFVLMWEYLKEKNSLDVITRIGSSCFKTPKVSVKKPTQKSEPNFLGVESLPGTKATISILNSPTWNEINIPIKQFKYEYETYWETKLRTANFQFFSIEGMLTQPFFLSEIFQQH